MKVRCIDFEWMDYSLYLDSDKIYEVESIIGNRYVLKDTPPSDGWLAWRFEVVDEQNSISDECPCGIVRSQCDYHK